ncbi:transcriptional repressor [Oscillibacter sp.]|uniref:Fur family transcriptional regulator n=1 Tax=Oscillibacter sp. TaxID=1945593 RepID=UPI0028A5AAC3|nr:transcriptional repressor [Oscillibacter sp.]
MQPQRYSLQREKIYAVVRGSVEHPTAEMVFAWLKPEIPRLSLGTVYRNLHRMAEEGRLQELPGPIVRFDGDTTPHAHFTCLTCGAVSDAACSYDSDLDATACKEGYQAIRHALMFYGSCPRCAQGEGKDDC